jgi:hypothetical protein
MTARDGVSRETKPFDAASRDAKSVDAKPRDAAIALERALAWFLSRGTWLSCAIVAAGMALQALHGPPAGVSPGAGGAALAASGASLVKAGVALLILLPTARVALTLAAFARAGERRYVFIAAIVLLVITAGFVIGLRTSGLAA